MAQLNISATRQGGWREIRDVPPPLFRARVWIEDDTLTRSVIVRVEAMCDRDFRERVIAIEKRISGEIFQTDRFDVLERVVRDMLCQLAYKAEQEMWGDRVANARPGQFIPISSRLTAEDEYKQLYMQQIDNLALTATPAMLGALDPAPAPKKPEPDYNPSNAYRLDTRDLTEETRHESLPVITVVIDL